MPDFIEWYEKPGKGQDVYVVAGGSSLIDFDFKKLNGKNIIGVNYVYRKVFCKYSVICDLTTPCSQAAEFRQTLTPELERYTAQGGRVLSFPFSRGERCPSWLYITPPETTRHCKDYSGSGSCAIYVALLLGYKRIILLGFDGKVSRGINDWYHGSDGMSEQEMNKDLQGRNKFIETVLYNDWREKWSEVEIINCNQDSALVKFPKCAFEDI